jgi:hypothetical protein
MKQSDDPKAFFEKFKFTSSMEMRSPEFPDEIIRFEGLEAKYVSELENRINQLEHHIKEMRDRLWWWQEKEYRIPFKKLMKDDQ